MWTRRHKIKWGPLEAFFWQEHRTNGIQFGKHEEEVLGAAVVSIVLFALSVFGPLFFPFLSFFIYAIGHLFPLFVDICLQQFIFACRAFPLALGAHKHRSGHG